MAKVGAQHVGRQLREHALEPGAPLFECAGGAGRGASQKIRQLQRQRVGALADDLRPELRGGSGEADALLLAEEAERGAELLRGKVEPLLGDAEQIERPRQLASGGAQPVLVVE